VARPESSKGVASVADKIAPVEDFGGATQPHVGMCAGKLRKLSYVSASCFFIDFHRIAQT
jgi:hypothetical protein